MENLTLLDIDLRVAGAVSGSTLVILGLFGNGLIIASIALNKQLRRKPNIPIASLAFSYSIPLLAVFPIYIHTYRTGYWLWDDSMCIYTFIMNSAGVVCSIMHMILIALYRYVMIVHPKFYPKLERKATMTLLLTACYAFPCFTSIFSKINFFTGKDKESHYFSPISMYCVTKSSDGKKNSGILGVLGMFLGFLVILAYFYCRIYWKVRQSRRRVINNSLQPNSNWMKGKMKAELSLVKVMLVTFVLYTASYIPWPVVWDQAMDTRVSSWVWWMLNMLLWSSCASMWLVYGVMNKQFRTAYSSLIVCSAPVEGSESGNAQSGNAQNSRIGLQSQNVPVPAPTTQGTSNTKIEK